MNLTRNLSATLAALAACTALTVGVTATPTVAATAHPHSSAVTAVVARPARPAPVLLGTLSSPSLGDIDVFETVLATSGERLIKETSLNVKGAGHIAGTPLPGELGVSVVAGHRTSGRRPFKNLNKVPVGEIITWTATDGTTARYKVMELAVLSDKKADAYDSFDRVMQNTVQYGSDHRLTLYACTRAPRNDRPWSTTTDGETLDARASSTTYRLAVFAVQI